MFYNDKIKRLTSKRSGRTYRRTFNVTLYLHLYWVFLKYVVMIKEGEKAIPSNTILDGPESSFAITSNRTLEAFLSLLFNSVILLIVWFLLVTFLIDLRRFFSFFRSFLHSLTFVIHFVIFLSVLNIFWQFWCLFCRFYLLPPFY